VTSRSITERYRLEAELQKNPRTRLCHYARTTNPGRGLGLGAPIFSSSGDVIGDICLTLPRAGSTPTAKIELPNSSRRAPMR